MGKLLQLASIPVNAGYQKGLEVRFAINEATCGAVLGEFGHTILPPGISQKRHFHANCETSMYIIRGRLRCLLGDSGEEVEAGPGSFLFLRQGEVHAIANPSEDEDCELVWTHSGVGAASKAGTSYIE